ncbi:MAG: domain S-box protein [Gammaproteobacteria bacterium]|jgi:PAS domain S-box-containing protein|nr:domain S-box protein [Gammaproteobacteria bacterium]
MPVVAFGSSSSEQNDEIMASGIAAPSVIVGAPVRIILIDDNLHDRALLEREFALRFASVMVEHVRCADELEVALEDGRFDLAITDYRLQWTNGVDVLRQIKTRWPTRPVIMFTASGSEEIAVQAMKEGLDDYIMKTEKHFTRIPYAVTACLERTMQRQALETALTSLRESEARFRHMAEAMPQILYSADADGKVQYTNDRWSEYTGFAEHTPEIYAQIIPDPDREKLLAAWLECRAAGTPFDAEFRMRRARDGALRWFLTRALPLFGEDGRIYGWLGTSTDIHDQKCAAEELQDADRRKDAFLATLAHELRNPLAPIRNAVRFLLLKGSADPDLQNAHDIIDRQAQQLVRLVDDLLDVSRLTLGKLTLHKEQVNLGNVISIALESVRPIMEAEHHELTVSGSSEPIYVHADITRLCQVFTNLLNNAAKFTPSGGYISVRLARENRDALIEVRDNGIGIPPEVLASVFDLFTQVKRSSGEPQDGLGIGLTLARQLVEMHGGTITAHSEGNGRGSQFMVRIPAHERSTVSAPDRNPSIATHGTQLAGRRILVVDDNRDAADSLSKLLELSECEVRKGYNGMDALETARQFDPEAILLDIGMPQLDGFEVCRRIRKEPWGKEMIVVALTGWGQDADRRRTKEAGFDAHLVKPIHPDSAIDLLVNLLRNRELKRH